MELKIGANILELRKAKQITQEQLAEAVGVSIAAVSKWECAATYPDIALLPAIVSYFEVYINALIDYQVQSNVLQEYIEKAIEYYNKALAVKPTNSPTRKESILQNIAFAYGSIHEYDMAISILEEINVNGVFDPEISFNMIETGKINEAMSKLQNYLFSMAFGFATVTESLGRCFREKENLQYVVDLQLLHATFLASFTHDTPNYCDLLCSKSYIDLAKFQREVRELEGMWDGIEKSVYHAVRFDQQPSYALTSVKFMDGREGWLANNSSENACREALNRIRSDFSEFQTDVRYAAAINKLESAATDKRESGIWV